MLAHDHTRDTPGVIAPPPLIALAAVLIGLALDWLLPAYVLIVLLSLPARIVIGLVVMAAGGALGIAAVLAFRRAQTHVEPWKPSSALVTDGIFNWLRNPMYVGLTLMLTGFAIMIASDWTLVMMIAFAVVLHLGVVKREERYLETKFGDAYRGYKARVPRYGWPPV
jgi:protein-S-isoprenylcysteine O-methyltransferase Ste14